MQGIKSFFQMLWDYLKKIGNYIKPYLVRAEEWRRRVWKKYQINKILLLLVLVTVLVTTIYLFIIAKSTNVASLEDDLAQRTIIYDKDGQEAGSLYGEKGTNISLGLISENIQNAVISTEDKRFYDHNGFDIIGIGRAFVKGITSGRISGGGSTITQQLAKNAYLTQKQTLDRKAKELFLAIEIEKKYSKKQILAMYLNNAYLGNGVWGVQDASEKYFGKPASEVDVAEAAMLIGMLKGPSIYNPIDDYDAAIERRNIVIGLMETNGKIDSATAEAAKAEVPVLVDNYQEPESGYKYPYFFDEVIKEATETYGIKEDDILKKGYKIYTTLDQNYQAALDTTFSDDSLFPNASSDGAIVQAGSSVIDPKTGAVYALIGGRGDHTYRGFNRATDTKLPPGSTMKPLSVYTPALEAGYTPNSMLPDEPLSYYDVRNYDGVYSGEIPMYQAVAESKNAPAVWLLNEIGINKGAKKVEKFGISLDKEDYYLGLALGGLTEGVSPLQLASAYGVFANSGYRQESYLITKIVDASDQVVAERKETKSIKVTTPEVVNEMTSMLQSVFNVGTGVNAKPYGFNIAGKTGTTENVNTETEAKDQWIVGYTPDVVIATWIGFDMSSDTHYLTAGDIAPVFKDEAQRVLSVSPQTPFSVADASTGVVNDGSSSDSQTEWDQTIKDIGGKVKEESSNLGGKLKEGASKVKNKLSSWIQEWRNSQ